MTKTTRILNRADLCGILFKNANTVLEISWHESSRPGQQGQYINQTYKANWHKPSKQGKINTTAVRVKQSLHSWYNRHLPWITDRFTVVLLDTA